MNKTLGVIALGILAAVFTQASTISSLTNTVGNSFTINAVGGSSVKFTDLVPSTYMYVTFSDNSTGACTFTSNGSGGGANVGCTVSGGGANIVLSPPNSQTNSAGWVINNLNSAGGLSIVTVTIDLGSSTSLVGFDSGSITTNSAGGTISGSAVLTDALHTSAQAASAATQFGKLILTFSAGTFGGGAVFSFNAANHVLTGPVVADTPEPATYALVGLGLTGLALFRKRRLKR